MKSSEELKKDSYFPNAASEFVYYRTYSRWIESEQRRETYPETVSRYVNFLKEERELIPPKILEEIQKSILNMDVMPSMRAMWSAGESARNDNTSMYNCSHRAVSDWHAFGEILYILMNGTGVGFSVEQKFIDQLPVVPIRRGGSRGIFRIKDSKLGWKQSLDVLFEAAFNGEDVEFDYSQIRARGSRLKTFGGRASGPDPLIKLHNFCQKILHDAQGRKMTDIECHDIVCMIADIVVVGGVRRSALISVSDLDSIEMRHAKDEHNLINNAHRYLSNNSAIYYEKPSLLDFLDEWTALAKSGTGERGIYNISNVSSFAKRRDVKNYDLRPNPCAEILLRSNGQFCNLSEVVLRPEDDFDSLLDKIRIAVWIGVIQSTFTYFPHLGKQWKDNCEEERLLGVSITGQMDNPSLLSDEKLEIARKYAIKVMKKACKVLGVNESVAITTVKPSGCRPWDAITTTDNGILTIEEMFKDHPDNSEWGTVNDLYAIQDDSLEKITKSYVNGDKEVFKIKMSYGLSVESTANHMWSVNGEWKRTDQIIAGDILDINYSGVYKKTDSVKLLPVNEHAVKMRNDSIIIKQPETMNTDLAWLIGYLWGDGAMSPSKFRIRFTDENYDILEKASKIIFDQFGLESYIADKAHESAYTLDVSSKHLWHWLIKNNVWKYWSDSIDIIPECIRKSSKEDILAFYAGLLDSDGWVGIKSGFGNATITTAYPMFAKHIQNVSWAIGLNLYCSHNTSGDSFQKKKSMYLLGISAATDLDSWNTLCKYSIKVKRSDIEKWQCEKQIKYVIGKVKSVESIGVMPTYDVEVDNSHWYYAGAVKSHNTVSQVVDSSSGMHLRYSPFYIRRYRVADIDPLFHLLKYSGFELTPENGQSEETATTWVVSFPVKSPEGALTRNDMTAIEQLEWYKKIQKYWCEHNVSSTVYVKDDEWIQVANWLYNNWDSFIGISFLPHDGGKYEQAPYEEINEEKYNEMLKALPSIDYSFLSMFEKMDMTQGEMTLACVGTNCEI